jgi:hypothetical protein
MFNDHRLETETAGHLCSPRHNSLYSSLHNINNQFRLNTAKVVCWAARKNIDTANWESSKNRVFISEICARWCSASVQQEHLQELFTLDLMKPFVFIIFFVSILQLPSSFPVAIRHQFVLLFFKILRWNSLLLYIEALFLRYTHLFECSLSTFYAAIISKNIYFSDIESILFHVSDSDWWQIEHCFFFVLCDIAHNN